jgi:hypothetical protein
MGAYKDTASPPAPLRGLRRVVVVGFFTFVSLSSEPLCLYFALTTCWIKCLLFINMAPLILCLTATVLFAQSTVAFNCSKKPIYVDIHKRAVHDSPVFQYGSFIGLGTPAQNQSLWPSLAQNHTSFASHSYCNDNSTLKNCERSTGGFFNKQDSTS